MEKELELIHVLEHHLKGGTFEYKSYDHKKAKDHFLRTDEGEGFNNEDMIFNEKPTCDKWDIPKEIRDQYSYWRRGKLRQIQFNPKGEIYRIHIGAKRAVSFFWYNLDDLKLIGND